MGLLGLLIAKGVTTAARNSTIRAAGAAAASVIDAQVKKQSAQPDIIVKKGITLIRPTRSSDKYHGEDAREIAQELLGAGFENITLKPVYSLGERGSKRYGEVRSVTINGDNDFYGVKRFPATSNIVIQYLDFKTSVGWEVYTTVERITPGTVRRNLELEATAQNEGKSRSQHNMYCCYCGTPIAKEGAKFCFNCGKEL